MAEDVQQTAPYWFTTCILVYILGPICLYMVLTHSCRYYNAEILKIEDNTKESKNKKILPLHREISIVTIIMIISMSIGPIWGVFTYSIIFISPSSDNSCNHSVTVIYTSMYYIGKGCMYLIFIMRLHSVYGTSAFGYKPLTLKIAAVTVIITTLTLCILTNFDATEQHFDFILFNKKYTHCNVTYPDHFIVIYGFHEVFVTLITLIMFIIPLRKLLKAVKLYGGQGIHNHFCFCIFIFCFFGYF